MCVDSPERVSFCVSRSSSTVATIVALTRLIRRSHRRIFQRLRSLSLAKMTTDFEINSLRKACNIVKGLKG